MVPLQVSGALLGDCTLQLSKRDWIEGSEPALPDKVWSSRLATQEPLSSLHVQPVTHTTRSWSLRK